MHGSNRELITVQCCVCKRWVALRVDKDDLAAVQHGKALIQDACPYLSADERELFLTGTCRACWDLLCPADRLAYS